MGLPSNDTLNDGATVPVGGGVVANVSDSVPVARVATATDGESLSPTPTVPAVETEAPVAAVGIS